MENNEIKMEELEAVSGGAKAVKSSGGSKTRLPEKAGCIVYQVQHNDNLTRIAKTYNTTVDAIMSVNGGILTDRNFIREGYYIYVPFKG